MSSIPLDEWVDKNAGQLKKDIEASISVFGDESCILQQQDLLRAIMISIRQWREG